MSNQYMLDSLDAHRSIRHFSSEPIPTDQVNRLMRLAQRASSGGAAQVYSVIWVTEPTLRGQISEWIGQPVM